MDTGASISVLKEEVLPRECQICYDQLEVNGIGGKIKSSGYVNLDIHAFNGDKFQNIFYVFRNLPIAVDGILGIDFMTKYEAKIDLGKNLLTLKSEGKYYTLPIHNKLENSNSLVIPPRSETIHYVYLDKDMKDDCFVSPREITKDVFLAGAIARPKNKRIPIKILNTSEEEVKLNDLNIDIESINDYNILKFNSCGSNYERAESLWNLINLQNLNKEERESVEKICAKYSDIFFLPGDKLETANICEHSIKLKNNINPIYTKPYRLPQSLKPEIKKQINKMLEDDIIEESNSEWSSPILLVPKKTDGSKRWRLVIDFRKLNENIVDDKFPLPNITDILDSLSGLLC